MLCDIAFEKKLLCPQKTFLLQKPHTGASISTVSLQCGHVFVSAVSFPRLINIKTNNVIRRKTTKRIYGIDAVKLSDISIIKFLSRKITVWLKDNHFHLFLEYPQIHH